MIKKNECFMNLKSDNMENTQKNEKSFEFIDKIYNDNCIM